MSLGVDAIETIREGVGERIDGNFVYLRSCTSYTVHTVNITVYEEKLSRRPLCSLQKPVRLQFCVVFFICNFTRFYLGSGKPYEHHVTRVRCSESF